MGDPAGAGNLLIQGDNLETLQALLPFYRGQVKALITHDNASTRFMREALKTQLPS